MTKQRRIILNDDGEERLSGEGATMVEDFLAQRFRNCVGSQVDSYFFNVAGTDRGPVVDGKVITNPQSSMAQFFYWGERGKIHPATDEVTRVLIDRAHDAGMEILVSVRMNDTHDFMGEINYPLKLERPDLLLGEQYWPGPYPNLLEGEATQGNTGYPKDSLMSGYFCGLDYAHEEVREHFLEFIEGYCRQYDYDGLELDYFRMPMFFKLGEEDENLDTMTEFVRQVRQRLDEIGRQRGKPYLLAARVLDTPAMALRTGLDVECWLKEGLLDLLVVGGGYMPYGGRVKEFIDMAHGYGVPAYPCINHFQNPVKMRSYASNFWALGADGVYVFNYYGVREGSEEQQCLQQMGDPEALLGLDKQYQPDNGFTWFPYGLGSAPPQFPVPLIYGTPIEIVVGDDVQKAAREGLLAEIRLQVKVANMDGSEEIRIQINGVPVPAIDIQRVAQDSFEALVQAPPLRRGINAIVILPGLHSVGRMPNTEAQRATGGFVSTVEGLDLSVRYKHE